jgi:Tfp pilus assembly protein PilF
VDAADKADRQALERERIAAQERIAGLQVGAKVAADKASLSGKQQAEGLRIGMEIAREQVTQAQQQDAERRAAENPPGANQTPPANKEGE